MSALPLPKLSRVRAAAFVLAWFWAAFVAQNVSGEEAIDLSKPETWGQTVERNANERSAIFDRLATYALGRSEFGRTSWYDPNDNTLEREKAFDLLLKVDYRRAIAFYVKNVDNDEALLHLAKTNVETSIQTFPCTRLLAENYWDAFPDIVRHLASRDLTDGETVAFRWLVLGDAPSRNACDARLGLPPVVDPNIYYGLPASALKFFEQYHGEHSPYRNNLLRILRPSEFDDAPQGNGEGAANAGDAQEHGEGNSRVHGIARPIGPPMPVVSGPQSAPPGVREDQGSRRDAAQQRSPWSGDSSNGDNGWLTPFIAGAAGLLAGFLVRGWVRK